MAFSDFWSPRLKIIVINVTRFALAAFLNYFGPRTLSASNRPYRLTSVWPSLLTHRNGCATINQWCGRLLSYFAFLALVSLSGCAGNILSGAGPSVNRLTDQDTAIKGNYEIIDLTANTIGPYLRVTEIEASSQITVPVINEILLRAGDVVKISISDSAANSALFAPLASGGTVFSNMRLNERGQVKLPYAGVINAKGLSLDALAEVIQRQLKSYATDPQVMVELTGDLSGSVLVAGAVKAPGRFSALQGPLTLLDAINQAGGPLLEPHLVKVIVRNGLSAQALSYEEVLAGKNLVLAPRSEVIVERARRRFVAMGAVGAPGLMDLPSNNPSLLEVLGTAGWLRESVADPSGVFVFRLDPATARKEAKATVFRLDLSSPAAVFLARQFLVQPEDAVYVTNAAVYEWQKIISPILQVLILGNTVNNASIL